jgi:ribose-phosphate pyrophosphokinase
MTHAVVFCHPHDADLAAALRHRDGFRFGEWHARRFPDGESYCRVVGPLDGEVAIVVARLDRPDEKLFGLLLAADAIRDSGAQAVFLAVPYLPYLRQDERFVEGEAISSRTLARLLEQAFDGLVTIDPHLHRTPDLAHLFGEWPAHAVLATELLAPHIETHWPGAVVVGPDEESEQWAAPLAAQAGMPFTTLAKERSGDREVEVAGGDTTLWFDRDVVLVDDIISTGRTLSAAAERIRATGGRVVACVATHGLFADDAMPTLIASGIAHVVTTNAVRHTTNAVDVAPLLAKGISHLLTPAH